MNIIQSSNPRLSICIPTYNRVGYLQKCLDTILSQVSVLDEDIQIVISDNASTDGTKDLVSKYQGIYKNIRYHRNAENIGANRNLFQVAECADGDYIWFMGDDDIIREGGIADILYYLDITRDIVLFQTNMTSTSGTAIIVPDGVEYWKHLVDEKKSHTLSLFLLFLSMVIVRRKDFIYHLSSYKAVFHHKLGEAFSHFYILVRCIYQKPILLVGNMVVGGDGDVFDDTYFKNSSKNWYNLVVQQGIDKISEDREYLTSIGITDTNIASFRTNFVKIYRYMQIGDILKITGLYRPIRYIFRKLFLKRI